MKSVSKVFVPSFFTITVFIPVISRSQSLENILFKNMKETKYQKSRIVFGKFIRLILLVNEIFI